MLLAWFAKTQHGSETNSGARCGEGCGAGTVKDKDQGKISPQRTQSSRSRKIVGCEGLPSRVCGCYPPPGCFRKRGCKVVKTKSGGTQTGTKRLQVIDSKGRLFFKKGPKREEAAAHGKINDLGLVAWDVVLRRAWRSGETRELCVVIYRDSLP